MSNATNDKTSDLQPAREAVERKWITPSQLRECAEIAEKVAAAGLPKSVSEILVEKKYLTRTQLNTILQGLGRALAEIGEYDILGKLGEGGMGAVYKVRHKTSGKIYALKTLKRELARDKDYLERFKREIRTTFTLSHLHVVNAIAADESNGTHYYIMEYIDGRSLEDLIKEKGPMEEQEASSVIFQVSQALALADAHRIVHRDIKPANILITADGIAKLCDLGLAKSADNAMTMTQTGTVMGTPYYLSPEQVRGVRNLDIRSDIYSLGVTLYYLLTGKRPFEGDNPHTVAVKRLKEDPPPPSKYRRDLSPYMESIVLKMMARERQNRFQTPAELIAILQPIVEGTPPSAPIEVKSAPPPHVRTARMRVKSQRKSPLPLVLGGIVVVAVIIAGIILFSPRPNRPADNSGNNTRNSSTIKEKDVVKPPPPPATDPEAERRKEAKALCDQGDAKYQRGDYRGAVEDYTKAIDRDPKFATAWQARGQAKIELSDYTAAVKDLDRAIDLDPRNAWSLYHRGSARAFLKQWREALADLDAAMQLRAEGKFAYARGFVKYQLKDYPGAIADARKAKDLDPALAEKADTLTAMSQKALQ